LKEIDNLAEKFATQDSKDDVSIAGIIGDLQGKSELIDAMRKNHWNFKTWS